MRNAQPSCPRPYVSNPVPIHTIRRAESHRVFIRCLHPSQTSHTTRWDCCQNWVIPRVYLGFDACHADVCGLLNVRQELCWGRLRGWQQVRQGYRQGNCEAYQGAHSKGAGLGSLGLNEGLGLMHHQRWKGLKGPNKACTTSKGCGRP